MISMDLHETPMILKQFPPFQQRTLHCSPCNVVLQLCPASVDAQAFRSSDFLEHLDVAGLLGYHGKPQVGTLLLLRITKIY